jgi:hypothetical protein
MHVALAIKALGLKKFADKGNMTKAEIDFLIDYLLPLKKAGHFRAFWENFGRHDAQTAKLRSRLSWPLPSWLLLSRPSRALRWRGFPKA